MRIGTSSVCVFEKFLQKGHLSQYSRNGWIELSVGLMISLIPYFIQLKLQIQQVFALERESEREIEIHKAFQVM